MQYIKLLMLLIEFGPEVIKLLMTLARKIDIGMKRHEVKGAANAVLTAFDGIKTIEQSRNLARILNEVTTNR